MTYSPIQTYADFKLNNKSNKRFENLVYFSTSLIFVFGILISIYAAIGSELEHMEAKPYKTVAEYNEYKSEVK